MSLKRSLDFDYKSVIDKSNKAKVRRVGRLSKEKQEENKGRPEGQLGNLR